MSDAAVNARERAAAADEAVRIAIAHAEALRAEAEEAEKRAMEAEAAAACYSPEAKAMGEVLTPTSSLCIGEGIGDFLVGDSDDDEEDEEESVEVPYQQIPDARASLVEHEDEVDEAGLAESCEEENGPWEQARETLKAELDGEEAVTLVLTADAPCSLGEPSEELVSLFTPLSKASQQDEFGCALPPPSWELMRGTAPEPGQPPPEGPIISLNVFNTRTNITCRRSMLKGTKVADRFAVAAMAHEENAALAEASLDSRRRVVVDLDGGCVRADVASVAEVVIGLCGLDPPEITAENMHSGLLAGHVLGHRLAVARGVQMICQHLELKNVTLALRCGDATENSRLLKMVFYFLRGHFIRHGTRGELQLLDGEVLYVPTQERAATWPLTSAAMDVEKRLEATGCYSLDPEIRKCYVQRIKGSSGLPDRYSLFAEGTNEFMLSAHKLSENVHIISLSRLESSDVSEGNDDYVGRVEANFLGTKFHIYDHGIDPTVIDPTSFPARPRLVLGSCHYESNRVITLPREMTVTVGDGAELENVPPRWNEAAGCYMLNFGGRVKKASVKNFILAKPSAQDHTIMLFGKVTSDRFALDFRAPLSPTMAFSIALSSLTRKKMVT